VNRKYRALLLRCELEGGARGIHVESSIALAGIRDVDDDAITTGGKASREQDSRASILSVDAQLQS
jgi:hypothetical protein